MAAIPIGLKVIMALAGSNMAYHGMKSKQQDINDMFDYSDPVEYNAYDDLRQDPTFTGDIENPIQKYSKDKVGKNIGFFQDIPFESQGHGIGSQGGFSPHSMQQERPLQAQQPRPNQPGPEQIEMLLELIKKRGGR